METGTDKSKNSKAKSAAKKPSSLKSTKTVEVKSGKAAGSGKKASSPAKKSATNAIKRQRTSVAARRKRLKPDEPQPEITEMPKNPTAQQLKTFQRLQKKSRELAKKRVTKGVSKAGFLAKPGRKGKKYNIDLRIHSPASEGYFSTGGVETSEALVRLAKVKGLHMISVTDFYDCTAIDSVRACAEKSGISVIPGLDLRCKIGACSEVFITALFPEECETKSLAQLLDALNVPVSAGGDQTYVVERDFSEVLELIESRGGIAIPTRMDKTPYRQLALPALINDYGFRAFDLVHPENTEYFQLNWPTGGFNFLTFSNANSLAQVGGRTSTVKLPEPGFAGLREVLGRNLSGDSE